MPNDACRILTVGDSVRLSLMGGGTRQIAGSSSALRWDRYLPRRAAAPLLRRVLQGRETSPRIIRGEGSSTWARDVLAADPQKRRSAMRTVSLADLSLVSYRTETYTRSDLQFYMVAGVGFEPT